MLPLGLQLWTGLIMVFQFHLIFLSDYDYSTLTWNIFKRINDWRWNSTNYDLYPSLNVTGFKYKSNLLNLDINTNAHAFPILRIVTLINTAKNLWICCQYNVLGECQQRYEYSDTWGRNLGVL